MAIETVDLTGDAPPSPVKAAQRKRKAAIRDAPSARAGSSKAVDLTQDDDEDATDAQPQKKAKRTKKAAEESGEKRLKRHRPTIPSSIKAIYDRAVNQRMFCLGRERGGDDDCPTETLKIAGSTGNVYTVIIDRIPSCDCPHAAKGNECKHVLFAMVRVLKASDYWQKAYLASELRTIFEHAPPVVVDAAKTDSNRKPLDEENPCAVCFEPMESLDDTTYCQIGCGQNLHKECFRQWELSRQRSAAPITCPYCRTRWATGQGPQGSIDMNAVSQRATSGEGYVNVAGELGVSTQRDYSSYNSFWLRQRERNGEDTGDWYDPNPPQYRGYDRYGGRYGD